MITTVSKMEEILTAQNHELKMLLIALVQKTEYGCTYIADHTIAKISSKDKLIITYEQAYKETKLEVVRDK